MSFQVDPLTNAVAIGLVQPTSVRLWIRAEQPGWVSILWWLEGGEGKRFEAGVELTGERDHTCSVELPAQADDGEPFTPLTRYEFRVVHAASGQLVGQGRFETAPATPSATPAQFAIGLMSCNQPFDNNGAVQPNATQMLRAARQCLHAHDAKFVLTVGDQIYADYPSKLSLFAPNYFATVGPMNRQRIQECTAQEVRNLYHARYRTAFGLPEWQALHAEFPCYPILDDHDIVDNWGSSPAHQRAEWRTLQEGARMAYVDYQASRVSAPLSDLPDSFHYDFVYGHTAAFVVDARSNRTVGPPARIVTASQLDDLREFMARHGDKKILFIVISVPIIHLPTKLAQFFAWLMPSKHGLADRWSTLGHVRNRDQILQMVHRQQQRYPQQQIVLLSGDVHSGWVHKMVWNDTKRAFYQFVSSPITNMGDIWVRRLSNWLTRLNREFRTAAPALRGTIQFLKGVNSQAQNPLLALNIGIVDVRTDQLNGNTAIRFSLYSHKEDESDCVYQSSWIPQNYD